MTMDANILQIIVYTVLIYCFEHKILPTVIISGLSLYGAQQLITASIEESSVLIVFMYVIVFFYGCYMMAIAPHVENEHKNEDVY